MFKRPRMGCGVSLALLCWLGTAGWQAPAAAQEEEARQRAEDARAEIERVRRELLERRLDFGGRIGGMGGSTSISVTDQNGVRKVVVNTNGKVYTIEEQADLLRVTFTKSYGPDDLEELKKDHPDLHMHVTSFPSTSGNAKVTLQVNVDKTAEAASAEELEKQDPEAFEIYEKYREGRIGGVMHRVELPVIRGIERLRPREDRPRRDDDGDEKEIEDKADDDDMR